MHFKWRTIRKGTHLRCWYCDAEGDDAERVLFNCPRWINEKTLLKNYVGGILATNNVIDVVVSSEETGLDSKGFAER